MSGLFGLMLATIGEHPTSAMERFVFTDHLEGGVHIVVGLIGLFAMPQVWNLLENFYGEKMKCFQQQGTQLWCNHLDLFLAK